MPLPRCVLIFVIAFVLASGHDTYNGFGLATMSAVKLPSETMRGYVTHGPGSCLSMTRSNLLKVSYYFAEGLW